MSKCLATDAIVVIETGGNEQDGWQEEVVLVCNNDSEIINETTP